MSKTTYTNKFTVFAGKQEIHNKAHNDSWIDYEPVTATITCISRGEEPITLEQLNEAINKVNSVVEGIYEIDPNTAYGKLQNKSVLIAIKVCEIAGHQYIAAPPNVIELTSDLDITPHAVNYR